MSVGKDRMKHPCVLGCLYVCENKSIIHVCWQCLPSERVRRHGIVTAVGVMGFS